MKVKLITFIALLFCLDLSLRRLARADEGMWTFDNFPSDKVAATASC